MVLLGNRGGSSRTCEVKKLFWEKLYWNLEGFKKEQDL
jgi:hypothetical protein